MRLFCYVLIVSIMFVPTVQAKDSDCFHVDVESLAHDFAYSNNAQEKISIQKKMRTVIKACTKIIQSGKFNGKKIKHNKLDDVYYRRAMANKVFDNQQAIKDLRQAFRLVPHDKYLRKIEQIETNLLADSQVIESEQWTKNDTGGDVEQPTKADSQTSDSDCWNGLGEIKIKACSKILKTKRVRGEKINNKDLAHVYNHRGDAYRKEGQNDNAIADHTDAIRHNPKEPVFYLKRALAYIGKKLWDQAISDLNYAIDLEPKNADLYGIRSDVYVEKGLFDKAIADLNQGISLDPKSKWHFTYRAYVYNKLGNYDQAIEDASQAIRLDSKFARSYRHRGVAYSKKGDYKRAIADFDKAIQLDPNYKEAIKSRQIALNEMKHKEEAARENKPTKKQTKVANVQPKPKVITRTGKRIALVIGNDNYANLPPHFQLKKAQNDARSIATTFKSLGFDVMSGFDLKRRDMNIKLSKLAAKIEVGDEVMFFFAGHGVRIAGQNYLLPSDIPKINDVNEQLLKSESLRVDEITDLFRSRGARLSLLVLDACRNNPYKDNRGRSIGGTRGLAPMEPPEGTHVIYSAGAGQEALDRLSDNDNNPNSVFTRTFLPMVKQEGLELTRLSKLLKGKVRNLAKSVGHKQTPAVYSEVIGDVYLVTPK